MLKIDTRIVSRLSTALLLMVLFVACGGDEPDPLPPSPPEPVNRVVLVYMVANNNLGAAGYDRDDIDEMLIAARSGDIGPNGRLLVYHDGANALPVLAEIRGGGRIDTLKRYDGDGYAVEIARMRGIFDDMREYAPASEYGLVLWSHGTGWIQDGISDESDDEISALSFGQDCGRTMNVTSLARALSGQDFSFLYFDCCYMASVETLYELRHAVPLIAASATELPVRGSRYDLNISAFFADGSPDLVGAARNTFEHYNSLSGSARTCTMSVVRTDGLDALASATADIYSNAGRGLPSGYIPQCFSERSVASCNYFDFRDYVAALCTDSSGNPRFDGAGDMLRRFDEALAECVVYAAATPYIWNSVPLLKHCGMSTYILKTTTHPSFKNYDSLSWYVDVASLLK